jgi:hypothetical protein
MSATAAQIAQVRRMVNESGTTTYDDDAISTYIEVYPLLDERGEAPYTWDTTTTPPTQEANDDWIDTYDLNAAAADIWQEKAAIVAQDYDFKADGGSYSRSQVTQAYMAQSRYYRARRRPGTITLHKWPDEDSASDEDLSN